MTRESICIICYTTWPSKRRSSTNFEDKLEGNKDKFILHSFCRHFDLPLSKISLLQWNFQEEHLPFCGSCQELVENLVQLYQQLESIKKAIGRVKTSVKTQIRESWNKFQVGENNTQVVDGRVNVIRDLITGPLVCTYLNV